jgi:hypothetical protein
VEHSIVARRKTLAIPRPGNSSSPMPKPASIDSGRPISSSRLGQLMLRRSAGRSMRAASLNRRKTRASSVTVSSSGLSGSMSSQPRPAVPSTTPAMRNAIAEVTPRRSRGAETAA